MIELIDPSIFWALGSALSGNLTGKVSATTKDRQFWKIFGVSAPTCSKVWNLCVPELPEGVSPVHLLWTLYFLKQYGLEEVNAAFAQCDEKTFRKWCWIMIKTIAELELVRKFACFSIVHGVLSHYVFLLHVVDCFIYFLYLFLHATAPLGEQVHWGQWQPVPCLSGWD